MFDPPRITASGPEGFGAFLFPSSFPSLSAVPGSASFALHIVSPAISEAISAISEAISAISEAISAQRSARNVICPHPLTDLRSRPS